MGDGLMTKFNVGDTVRYNNSADMTIDYLDGHEGVIVGFLDGTDAEIRWNAPLPLFPYHDKGEEVEEPVTWSQYLSVKYLTLVEKPYDQDTVNAIVKWLREDQWTGIASSIEKRFAVPQTRTVSVNFQVPEGESVVDYLVDVGIDYDIEGGN